MSYGSVINFKQQLVQQTNLSRTPTFAKIRRNCDKDPMIDVTKNAKGANGTANNKYPKVSLAGKA